MVTDYRKEMSELFGYMGKLLFVNLSDRSIEIRDLNEADAQNFVGGAGLGAKILYDEMPAKADVFGPDSMIGFVTGPLTGSKALFGGRYTVVSKSPVTNGWNDANSGGYFGPELKKAGFDAVFVKGVAEQPVYVWIDNGKVEIKDARHLWGLTTTETEAALRKDIGDDKINMALIAPAGESLSHMAAIMNDGHRAAARGGSGAVMGAKKLKALVVRGNQKVNVADEAMLTELNKEIGNWMKEGPLAMAAEGLSEFGTNGLLLPSVLSGDTGVKNWKGAGVVDFPEDVVVKLTTPELNPKYRVAKYGCSACPIRCGAIYKSDSKKWPLPHTVRPEYETFSSFGPMLLVNDPEAIMMCNHLCNEYGFDTMSTGSTIAWAMECYEEGVITQAELDGIDLKWGNADAVVELLTKMCQNEGCGKWLRSGSLAAANALGKGHEHLVVASGIEEPQHDSRLAPARTRQYKYDPTPGRHTKGGFGLMQAQLPPEVKYNYHYTGFNEAFFIADSELVQSTGICIMSGLGTPPGMNMRLVSAVTGFQYSPATAYTTGLRIYHMRNAFNVREGIRRKDYTYSERGMVGPEAGPLKDVQVDVELLAENVFNAIGLDAEMMPERFMLMTLGGMEKVIEDLLPAPPPPPTP